MYKLGQRYMYMLVSRNYKIGFGPIASCRYAAPKINVVYYGSCLDILSIYSTSLGSQMTLKLMIYCWTERLEPAQITRTHAVTIVGTCVNKSTSFLFTRYIFPLRRGSRISYDRMRQSAHHQDSLCGTRDITCSGQHGNTYIYHVV